MSDKKSDVKQIAQAVLDETNQSIKVSVVSTTGGGGSAVDLNGVAGQPVDVGNGAAGPGTQRVVLASDQATIPVDIQDTEIAISVDHTEDSITIYTPGNNTTPIPVDPPTAVKTDILVNKTASLLSASDIIFIDGGNATGGNTIIPLRIDAASETVAYKGDAVPGTVTSSASWRISRITTTSSGSITIEYADGNTDADNIWDNRASLSYS